MQNDTESLNKEKKMENDHEDPDPRAQTKSG